MDGDGLLGIFHGVGDKIVQDLPQAIYATAHAADTERLYLAQKTGVVRLVLGGELQETPFIDISNLCEVPSTMEERGLLSIALAPSPSLDVTPGLVPGAQRTAHTSRGFEREALAAAQAPSRPRNT